MGEVTPDVLKTALEELKTRREAGQTRITRAQQERLALLDLQYQTSKLKDLPAADDQETWRILLDAMVREVVVLPQAECQVEFLGYLSAGILGKLPLRTQKGWEALKAKMEESGENVMPHAMTNPLYLRPLLA